jgi:hypothetical protein
MATMRTISFSVLKDKLIHRTKLQTIRRPRKQPLQVGEHLRVYWRQRSPSGHVMGTIIITSKQIKPLNHITSNEMIADGFGSLQEGIRWFLKVYSDANPSTLFSVIKFKWVNE